MTFQPMFIKYRMSIGQNFDVFGKKYSLWFLWDASTSLIFEQLMYPMHPGNLCLVGEIIAFLSASLDQNKNFDLSLKIAVKIWSVIFRRVPSTTLNRFAPSPEDHKQKTQF